LPPPPPPRSPLFPYTTLFRSQAHAAVGRAVRGGFHAHGHVVQASVLGEYELEVRGESVQVQDDLLDLGGEDVDPAQDDHVVAARSEEHTSELQSRFDLVCRLL